MSKCVADIVEEYLVAMGADGLAGEECGCGLDNLMDCEGYCGGCVPAKKIKTDCEKCDPDGAMGCHGEGSERSECYVGIETKKGEGNGQTTGNTAGETGGNG